MTSVLILLSGFDPGTYFIEDDGDPTNGIVQLRGPGGTLIPFNIPTEHLTITASSERSVVFNLGESFGTADIIVGNLTNSTDNPDSIRVAYIRGAGDVTLVANKSITESGSDAAADIKAATLIMSAGTGVGTGANAIETQVATLEAETVTGGIRIGNFGNLTIGGLTDDVVGLDVETSGNLVLTNLGSIILNEASPGGFESVHGGSTSGSVTLIANGASSDITSLVDRDAISAPGGGITLTAGRDILFGTGGLNFDNDVRARNNLTINAGRDVNVDGFADLASDGFGAASGGDVLINSGRDINVLNATGSDGSIGAEGAAGGKVTLNAGPGGFLRLLASSTATLFSTSGDVTVKADRVVIGGAAGITANNGAVTLRTATNGWAIDLGSATDGAFALELSDTELDRIFTPSLTIGDAASGLVSVTSALTPGAIQTLSLIGGADISIGFGISGIQTLNLFAGDNLLHFGGTLTATTVNVAVDGVGADEGAGGWNVLGTVTATTITLSGNVDADTLTGTSGSDVINGNGGNDTIDGGAGIDTINGGSGDDSLNGGGDGTDELVHGNGGKDTIISTGEGHYFGDGGNDTILGGLSSGLVSELLDGGAGIDTLDTRSFNGIYTINLATGATNFAFESFVNFENIFSGDGNDTITGTDGVNVIDAGAGNDEINGASGHDTLIGGAGIDTLNGGGGNDTMAGGADDDFYVVGQAGDIVNESASEGTDTVTASINYTLTDNVENLTLTGTASNGTGNGLGNVIDQSTATASLLEGLAGDDTLTGNAGNDTLRGSAGQDTLIGGAGRDILNGGADRDIFIFRDGHVGTTAGSADVVVDFDQAANEKLRLGQIDAVTTTGGDQAFTWIGAGAFTNVAGQLRFEQTGGNTFVQGDTDGDGSADFFIRLNGLHNLVAADFVL